MSSFDLFKYGLVLLLPAAYLARRYTRSAAPPPAPDTAPADEKPQLKEFDGSDASKPIYVSIKGTVFDGNRYNIFAGKDGSMGLGMSSLKDEHAVPDYRGLNDADRKVLDDWHGFFTCKTIQIVGKVIDHPVKESPNVETAEENPTSNL
ncbi:cytochrome b5 [Mycena olivaceomarginata]|nr:cytochrome b5 [Mycena olivaceomarginata]